MKDAIETLRKEIVWTLDCLEANTRMLQSKENEDRIDELILESKRLDAKCKELERAVDILNTVVVNSGQVSGGSSLR